MQRNQQQNKKIASKEMEVRWGECDAAGIVYYMRYFDWFSDGRIHFLRENNLPYGENFHQKGIAVLTTEASCRYHHPLKPEECFIIETELAEVSRARMVFKYRLVMADTGTLIAEGQTSHAYVSMGNGSPFDLKKRFPDLWERLKRLSQKVIGPK